MNYPKLKSAKQAFVIANTPQFLVKKLRFDPQIGVLARSNDPENAVNILRYLLSKIPEDVDELVFSYAIIVSLSMISDLKYLRMVRDIPSPNHKWIQDIVDILMSTTSISTYSSHQIAARVSSGVPVSVTSTGTTISRVVLQR